MSFEPFFLSFRLAFIVTLLLFVVVLPIGWLLSQSKSRLKPLLEAIFSLPIVLPPSVLGFYLLIAFSPNSFLGGILQKYFDLKLVFSFEGLVVASMIYSFPFMLQPIQNGFESIEKNMLEASFIAGKGKLETILNVALPNMKPSIISGIVVTFAHTIGEFGVVLMVGGSIPHQTKVASVAIYEMVENMDYKEAHIYSAIMLLMSFLVLLFVYMFNHKQKSRFLR